jgi:DNA-binding NarL/FixJ family response regulator
VLKDNSAEDLITAIRTVHAGKFFVSPGVTGVVVDGYLDRLHDNAPDRIDTSLSSRQREMVELICGGASVKDIARDMDLPVHTVKVHRQNIMRILDAKSTTDLLKQAIRRGIVQI